MYENASQNRIRAVILWGAVCALSWAALSVFFGGSAAHADDQSPSNPLSSITSLVSSTVTDVTDPVVHVVEPVVQKVAPLIEKAAPVVQKSAEPVVKAVAQPVAKAAPAVVTAVTDTTATVPVAGPVIKAITTGVADVAQSVTAPATETLHQQPISSITDPVLDVVEQLPVIGDLGVTGIVRSVVGILDGTVADVAGGADTILPPVIGALDPTAPEGFPPVSPPDGGSPLAPAGTSALPDAALLAAVPSQDAAARAQAWASALAVAQNSALSAAAAATVSPTSPTEPGVLSVLEPAAAPASSSGASGGGSAGSAAVVNDAFIRPSSPWTSRFGGADDALPSSPSTSFDVSPD